MNKRNGHLSSSVNLSSESVNKIIQMKATVQYFPGITLDQWMKSWSVTIQMKATVQYFPVLLFIYAVSKF